MAYLLAHSSCPYSAKILGKISLTHLGIDDYFYDSGMGPRQCGTWLYFDYLWELAEALPQGTEKDEAYKKWSADGANLTGAFYGGWILALLYFLAWIAIGWIAKKLSFLKGQNN